MDLLLIKDGQRIGVECKRIDAPRPTASMHTALHDLQLSQLLVIYPGALPHPLDERMRAISLNSLADGWLAVS